MTTDQSIAQTEREQLTKSAIIQEAEAKGISLAAYVATEIHKAFAARYPGGYNFDKIVSLNNLEDAKLYKDTILKTFSIEYSRYENNIKNEGI